MATRAAIEAKIAHNAAKLEELGSSKDNARVRKRTLQALGKLKKELAALGDAVDVSGPIGGSKRTRAEDEDEDEEEGNEAEEAEEAEAEAEVKPTHRPRL